MTWSSSRPRPAAISVMGRRTASWAISISDFIAFLLCCAQKRAALRGGCRARLPRRSALCRPWLHGGRFHLFRQQGRGPLQCSGSGPGTPLWAVAWICFRIPRSDGGCQGLLALKVAVHPQAAHGAGQVVLGHPVFLDAAFLQQGLLGLVGGAAGAVGVDLLGALGGVHQDQDVVALHLDQAGRDGGDLFPAGVGALGGAVVQLAGGDGRDHVAVVGLHPERAVGAGHHQVFAGALKKHLVGGQDAQMEGVHHTSPASIFLAFSTTSAMVPTLKKAASGYWSIWPSTMAAKPLMVSSSGT